MELTRILRLLWERRLWLVVGLVVAVAGSVLSAYRLSISPFGLHAKTVSYGSASTQVFVDSQRSSITTLTGNAQPLASRSTLLAQFLASTEVRADIDQRMGQPANSIPVISNPATVQQAQNVFTSFSDQSGGGAGGGYRISFQPEPDLPIIDIYTAGPNAAAAIKLADVAASSLARQVSKLSDASGVPADSPSRIVMREIGPATGGEVATKISAVNLLLTFVGIFIGWCVLIVFFSWLRADWRRTASEPTVDATPVNSPG